jgi:hypothetical protein
MEQQTNFGMSICNSVALLKKMAQDNPVPVIQLIDSANLLHPGQKSDSCHNSKE